MPDIVEIYCARGDQNIREGSLDYSQTITTRAQAEADAAARCQRDPTIRKIAYYIVRDDGSFKTLLGYDNPNPVRAGGKPIRRQMADPLPRIRKKPAPGKSKGKPTLVDRLINALSD